MVFTSTKKKRPKKMRLAPQAKKKQNNEGAPLNIMPMECNDNPSDKYPTVPPQPLLEGVQTYQADNDNTHDDILNEENNILFPNYTSDNQVQRLAIAHAYRFILNAPPTDEWEGADGSLSRVCQMFGWSANMQMKRKIRKYFVSVTSVKSKGYLLIISIQI